MLQLCLIIWIIEEVRIPASPWTNSVVEGSIIERANALYTYREGFLTSKISTVSYCRIDGVNFLRPVQRQSIDSALLTFCIN